MKNVNRYLIPIGFPLTAVPGLIIINQVVPSVLGICRFTLFQKPLMSNYYYSITFLRVVLITSMNKFYLFNISGPNISYTGASSCIIEDGYSEASSAI